MTVKKNNTGYPESNKNSIRISLILTCGISEFEDICMLKVTP